MKALAVKFYDLPLQYRKQIAQELGCSMVTVRKAMELTNPVVGELSERARARAVEKMNAVNWNNYLTEAEARTLSARWSGRTGARAHTGLWRRWQTRSND